MADCVTSASPSISLFKKQFGETAARAIVTIFVDNVCQFFNTVRVMSDAQMAQTVDLIIQEYHYFKPDDFKICFNKAMTNKYGAEGKVFDRIDGSVILSWLAIHAEQRVETAQYLSDQLHLQTKNDSSIDSMSQEGLKELRKVIESIESKSKEIVNKPFVERKQQQQSESDKMVQQWLKDFDEKYDKKIESKMKIKVVLIEGKTLDHNLYLDYRLKQHVQQVLEKNNEKK